MILHTNYLITEKTHHTNELVRLYLETGQTALAKQVLANSNSDWAKLILLKHAIANNTADVATLISAMPNNQAISNLISDNNNTRYFKNIDAQNLNTQIPDSTDITLNKQARWSYLNNKQINRLLNDEKSFDNKIVETKFHENFNSINVLNIFPNPSTQGFNISSENSGDITVYDYTGKIVEQKLISNDTIQIGENYSKGVYVIVFKTSGAETAHYKIIKQ